MAEKKKEAVPEEEVVTGEIEEPEKSKKVEEKPTIDVESWNPKTGLGKRIKNREVTSFKEIVESGLNVMEPEITDLLIPNISTDLLMIGQSKGKFGGGQRRVFRQTQKKTQEGNKPKFATCAVVGNEDGYVGIGFGKSKETVPAREKAIRNAKLSVFRIKRGCGSWQCSCKEPHSIPFKSKGKCGSAEITLMPAPKGVGLCVEKECAKILKMAGVKDIWSKTKGQTKTKVNLIKACIAALENLNSTKTKPEYAKDLGMVEGGINE